jgi:hypothetical protein
MIIVQVHDFRVEIEECHAITQMCNKMFHEQEINLLKAYV